MKDDYFSDYVLESPKQIEKTIIKQELTPPSQLPPAQLPVAPPQIAQNGPLPPGFQMPNVQVPNVQAPPLPNAEGPMNVTAPPIDVQALAEKAKEIKKTLGPVQAQSPINKDMVLPILGGVGGLATLAAIGYGLSKTDNRKSIPDRDIRKIEPQLNVSSTQGNIDPVYHEPVFTVGSTGPMPNDVSNSPDYIAHTNLENASNGILTNEDDARLISNSERNKINNTIAKEAGVTPETSQSEADLLVTNKENSLTPGEKAQQKNEIKNSLKPSKNDFVGPIKPIEIPEGRIPNYMEYKMKNGERVYVNKKGEDIIGKGAYNWLQGQWGPEKTQNIFEGTFGKKNVSYEEMQKAIAEGKLPVPPKDEKGRGGSFPREHHVPDYIKGNINPSLLHGMLTGGLAGLAALHEGQNAKEAYQRGDTSMAASHLRELGNLTLPGMIANGLFGINPEELQTLRSAEQARKVGGGRGIAPPSR